MTDSSGESAIQSLDAAQRGWLFSYDGRWTCLSGADIVIVRGFNPGADC